MTLDQQAWCYRFQDDENYHFDPWKHSSGPTWVEVFSRRVANAAGGYAATTFNPKVPFVPDTALLSKYPGCLSWNTSPSCPTKIWSQLAMSWSFRNDPSGGFFSSYLKNLLQVDSYKIPRHTPYVTTLSSAAFITKATLSTAVSEIALKPNNFYVVVDPAEAHMVDGVFKRKTFEVWCKLCRTVYKNGQGGDFAAGFWGTYPLCGLPESSFPYPETDLLQILAQGLLEAFWGK